MSLELLATRLRVELALRNRYQDDVAQDAGISPSTLSRILRAKQNPSDALVRRIEAAIREEAVPHD